MTSKEFGPLTSHPNLSDEINKNLAESELAGGAWLKKLAVGRSLKIQTKNTLYLPTKTADGFVISGHPHYCPTPTKAFPSGSTWGGSMLKIGFVGVGMHLEVHIDGSPGAVTTTAIQSVEEI